ncbi:MAG: hypothetical protein PHQ72_02550 [Hespellia sp.]|nr:hypothetical protein [Hespellia sp.]
MKLNNKYRLRMNIGIICSLAILSTSAPVMATSTENLESQSSSLQHELDDINSEILDMSSEIAKIEIQIEDTSNSIISTEEQLSIIKNTETEQYAEMKKRIQYMYENGSSSLLELLFSAEDIADFVNKADFISNISSYDQEQLDELKNTITTYEDQQNALKEQQVSLTAMESDLKDKKSALTQKAAATSTSIASISDKIEQIKAEEQKAAEEAAAQASASSGSSSGSSGSSSRPSYSYPTSGGALTPDKGVVYFNGHRETYYSQRVLPGTGLNIPGRHVAADGTIRDRDNYICVASSDLAKGTLVETSLGMGKVYDSGCASGTIDIYTDW